MKYPFPTRYLNRLLGLFVLALVSGFGLSGWWIVLAQCDPCPTTDPSYVLFEKGSTVYVDLDTRFTQDERDAVIAGFQSMNFANAYQNNSGVFYDTSTPPSGRPPSYNQINVAWGVLYNNDGTINYNSASRITPGPNQPGHQQATIVINTESRLGSVATGAPFFNPNAPGYSSVFGKIIRHETGHPWRGDSFCTECLVLDCSYPPNRR